jgi:hypothetical protein
LPDILHIVLSVPVAESLPALTFATATLLKEWMAQQYPERP